MAAFSLPADFKLVVKWQLGRKPGIKFSVAETCIYGWPAVISNEAFTRAGKPNPNLFYLTCPYLVKEISRLEDASLTREIQEQVQSDAALSANLKEVNRRYASTWLKKAGKVNDRFPVQPANISGTGDPLSVKCLHAHLAYYLVNKRNLVGEMVAAEIPELWCRDERCRDYLKKMGNGRKQVTWD